MGIQKVKYKLLGDPDIQRWYRNAARGSRVTADVYLRRLGGFCADHGMTPKELAAMGKRELEDLLMDSVGELGGRVKAGIYIKSIVKAVKSWLSYNRRELKVKTEIRRADNTQTLREERVPTKNELLRILLSEDRKARTAAALGETHLLENFGLLL